MYVTIDGTDNYSTILYGDRVIYLSSDLAPGVDLGYYAAHEFFHQVQYNYAGSIALNFHSNWFQEASAEWAAQQFLTYREDGTTYDPNGSPQRTDQGGESVDYALRVGAFVKNASTGGGVFDHSGFGGPLQYGALALIGWLSASFDQTLPNRVADGTGPWTFVERVLIRLGNHQTWYQDFDESIKDSINGALTELGTSWAEQIPWFWRSMSTLCPQTSGTWLPGPAGDPWEATLSPYNIAALTWCTSVSNANLLGDLSESVSGPTYFANGDRPFRPGRTVVPLGPASTETQPASLTDPIGADGVHFYEFVSGTNRDSRRLSFHLDDPAGTAPTIMVLPWDKHPGDANPPPPQSRPGRSTTGTQPTATTTTSPPAEGEACAATEWMYPAGNGPDINITVDTLCPNVTVAVVPTHSGTTPTVTWQSHPRGVLLTTTGMQLGVVDTGAIGLDSATGVGWRSQSSPLDLIAEQFWNAAIYDANYAESSDSSYLPGNLTIERDTTGTVTGAVRTAVTPGTPATIHYALTSDPNVIECTIVITPTTEVPNPTQLSYSGNWWPSGDFITWDWTTQGEYLTSHTDYLLSSATETQRAWPLLAIDRPWPTGATHVTLTYYYLIATNPADLKTKAQTLGADALITIRTGPLDPATGTLASYDPQVWGIAYKDSP